MALPLDLLAGKYRLSDSPWRVRAQLGAEIVVDTRRAQLLHVRGPAHYCFPLGDIRPDVLTPSAHRAQHDVLGEVSYWNVSAGGKEAANGAFAYEALPGLQLLDFKAMDHWYQEDDEIFVHPRDPYHRVDVMRSSRHVRIEIDGQTVADSHRPSILFETGHPLRYYIPQADVRMELLQPSQTHTSCPYKGDASYWSAVINGKVTEDVVWTYPKPIPECPKIEQLLSFYNEKVNVYVDGELETSPVRRFPT